MARWPWVSRGMHLEVIAAKNEVIFNLQRHVASLEEQLKNPAPVNVKVEMPTIQVPSPVLSSRRRGQAPAAPAEVPPPDWESIDPNDNKAIALAAAHELGPTYSPYMLSECVKRIKYNIQQAKLQKVRSLIREGADLAGLSPETPRATAPPLETDERVPAHVLNMIEEADRG